MKQWANWLLAAWLIIGAIIILFDVSFKASTVVLALLALAAGTLIILGDRGVKMSANLGRLVLAGWLILGALITLIDLQFKYSNTVLAVLGLVAGVLLVVKR